MYYRIKNNTLYDYADYKYAPDCLETNIISQYALDLNPNRVIVEDGILVINPNFYEEEALKREINFKSQFFEIENFGWYRKIPKGYSSAVESLNTALNAVSLLNKLPANTLIFYTEPDFSDPAQCTEQWLIEHQTMNQEMTKEQFSQFYMAFMTAWNTEMHNNLESEDE